MSLRLVALAACALIVAGSASAAPLADRHVGRGLKCENCHSVKPNVPEFKNCLECHAGVEVLKKRNPAHGMIDPAAPNCGMCHKAHKE